MASRISLEKKTARITDAKTSFFFWLNGTNSLKDTLCFACLAVGCTVCSGMLTCDLYTSSCFSKISHALLIFVLTTRALYSGDLVHAPALPH